MYDLQQSVRRQVELKGPHPNALEHQAARVRPLRQSVRPKVLSLQARGIILHASSSSVVRGEDGRERSENGILRETVSAIVIVFEPTAINDPLRHGVPYQRDSTSTGPESRSKKLFFGVLGDHQAHQDTGSGRDDSVVETTLQSENAGRGTD